MIVSEFLIFKNLEFNGPGPENSDTAGGLPNLRIPGRFLPISIHIETSSIFLRRKIGIKKGLFSKIKTKKICS